MTTAWSEGSIASEVQQNFLDRKCLVVVDRCSWTGNECDLLAVTNCLRIIDIEIKISRSDFKADAKKEKWWHRNLSIPGVPPFLEWPRRVWKHYFAMPEEIWDDSLLGFAPSEASGILLISRTNTGRFCMVCKRRAKPRRDAYKLTPEDCVAIARLANLRMWDAYRRLNTNAINAEDQS